LRRRPRHPSARIETDHPAGNVRRKGVSARRSLPFLCHPGLDPGSRAGSHHVCTRVNSGPSLHASGGDVALVAATQARSAQS
jgi:hypothetical protein